MIVAGATSAAFAAKATTATIPIVFATIDDPVKLGLVASLARPDGNLTGINWFASESAAKRLELLRELVPGAARIALLVEPANVRITEGIVRDVESTARVMGLQIRVLNANSSREIDAAFATLASERPDALSSAAAPFSTPSRPIGPLGDAPQDPRDICGTSICRSRRADELRNEPD